MLRGILCYCCYLLFAMFLSGGLFGDLRCFVLVYLGGYVFGLLMFLLFKLIVYCVW